jgi:hypothetical protein
MKRSGIPLALGAMTLLILTACGGGSAASTRTAQTATTGAVSDAATVTAYAKSQAASGTPGGQSTGGTIGTPAAAAGGGRILGFATFAPSRGATTTARSTTGPTVRVSGSPAARSTAAGVKGNMYTDPQGRFSFTIPQGWLVQQPSSADVDVEAAPPTLRGAFRLASDTMPANASLNDYASAVLDNIQTSFTNFQLIGNSATRVTIGGQTAVRYEFTGSQNGTNLHGVVYVVNKGDAVYGLFIAAAPEDYDAIANQVQGILDSFTFL